MKRIGVLVVVLIGLAWIGSIVVPRSEPAVAAAPRAVAEPSPNQLATPTAVESESSASMTAEGQKARQVKWFGAETIVAAERAVRAELKDPDAAQFRDVHANYTEEFGVVACGSVNARTERGGYRGFRRFVSGGKSVILEGRDNFPEAWSRACR